MRRFSNSIRSQGKLTDALEAQINGASTKADLEDLYLPYKPKRRTRADIARERGLGPLADAIFADRAKVPAELASAYLTPEVADVKAALEGARDILSESFAVNADLLGRLRTYMKEKAVLRSKVVESKEQDGAKFSDYFDHFERWSTTAATSGAGYAAWPQRRLPRSRNRSRCRRSDTGQAGGNR